jgi:hypothetical protein
MSHSKRILQPVLMRSIYSLMLSYRHIKTFFFTDVDRNDVLQNGMMLKRFKYCD